jgi:replicative DNA helicase
LWIDASAGQNVDTITAEATRIRDTHGSLALIVVDYLQLIRGPRSRDDLREQEVARTSGGLKQLAKALGCPVLSASQLNDDGRVRESRAITHDADSVLIIAEDGVKVLKMRNGQRNATLPLHLDGRLQRFTETRQ